MIVVGAIAGWLAGQIMRGYEQFFLDMLSDEALARAIFDKLLETYMERAARFFAEMKDAIDFIFVTDDLGTQEGPMVDPKLFRRLVKPYLARLFAFLKQAGYGLQLSTKVPNSVTYAIQGLMILFIVATNAVVVRAVRSLRRKELG